MMEGGEIRFPNKRELLKNMNIDMEVAECTKIVLKRIEKLEPENAIKIIGYLLLNYSNQEIIDYATVDDDKQIHFLINEAKAYIRQSPKPNVLGPTRPDYSPKHLSSPAIARSFPSSFRIPAPNWEPLMSLEEHISQLSPLPNLSSNYYYPDAQFGWGLGSRGSLRSPPSLPDFPGKACHYYYKGYCKHGDSCKYSHGLNHQDIPNSFSPVYSPNLSELVNDDQLFAPGSLETLEVEIAELLKARKGMPVSIASLPMMYLEEYGKALQAEGYLTESQRHGKAGFSLTKLLARLKTVRLIDRPHGQHSVVLAEDAPMYMDYRIERSDLGPALPSSHQIYLTFPAESTFTAADVSNYFEQFGPVHDVRIPRQEKRMFGFVSFYNPESVKKILAKGHPHNIGGSRVLVKPYKEKTRIYDRRYMENLMYYPPQFELDPHLNSMQRVCENSRLLKQQMMKEHEHSLELERRRLLELNLTPKPVMPSSYFNYGMEDLKVSEDHLSLFPTVKNNSCTSDDNAKRNSSNNSDQERSHVELPDSPFASPQTSIYTII